MTWDNQVGGDHYRKIKGEQHWDRVYRLFGPGYFIGCATKYIERYQVKNGKEDLEKAMHFIRKLISLEFPDSVAPPTMQSAFLGQVVAEGKPPEGDDKYTFRTYEENHPQYLHDEHFLCEGGSGDGTNLYRCRSCRGLLWAHGLQGALVTHVCNPPATAGAARGSDGS